MKKLFLTNQKEYIDVQLGQLTDLIVKSEIDSRIVYVVSEERNILPLICGCPNFKALLKAITGDEISKSFKTIAPKNVFKKMKESGIMADATRFFSKKKSAENALAEKPYILFVRDFHTLYSKSVGNKGEEFIKDFLNYTETIASEDPYNEHKRLLIIVSPFLDIPRGFERLVTVMDIPEIGETEIEDHIVNVYSLTPSSESKDTKKLVTEFKGLDYAEIDNVMNRVYATFNAYSGTEEISKYRRELIGIVKEMQAKRDPTISVLKPHDNVVGMTVMKEWSERAVRNYVYPEFAQQHGIPRPKGVLICGLPGTGKTQMAKKMAWDMEKVNDGGAIPLIQFRMDNILGGLVGDSEKNFKRCRKRIEALAPCIVLFDEIEKTFEEKGGGEKNDYKNNILTALLDWLQENKNIFFFATCNGTKIPPELVREGRFDMRFSAFLTPQNELSEIMKLHLKTFNGPDFANGNLLSDDFDYDRLAKEFFNEIAERNKKNKDNLFYTGTNIENLLKKTNEMLAFENFKNIYNGTSYDKVPPQKYNNDEYKKKLIDVAINGESQPYGKTNMKDIVAYWWRAKRDNYLDVSRPYLFDFDEEAFKDNSDKHKKNSDKDNTHTSCPKYKPKDKPKDKNDPEPTPKDKNDPEPTQYDLVMRERIFEELKKEYQKMNSEK